MKTAFLYANMFDVFTFEGQLFSHFEQFKQTFKSFFNFASDIIPCSNPDSLQINPRQVLFSSWVMLYIGQFCTQRAHLVHLSKSLVMVYSII